MTQYKNPFEDPEEKLWDQKIKDYKIPKRKETPLEEKVPDLKGYIYVPTIGLYVAKEKSLYNLYWHEAHKELHKKGLQVLTIRQFIDFLLYLKQNPDIKDAKNILDEVLTKREHYRGECLDAMFSKKGGQRYISYNHRIENGELVAKNIEPLEKCLMEDCYIDLKSCNRQGLPTKKGDDIMYHYPIIPMMEGCVAIFEAIGNLACLHCDWAADSHSFMGVRATRKVK